MAGTNNQLHETNILSESHNNTIHILPTNLLTYLLCKAKVATKALKFYSIQEQNINACKCIQWRLNIACTIWATIKSFERFEILSWSCSFQYFTRYQFSSFSVAQYQHILNEIKDGMDLNPFDFAKVIWPITLTL